MPFLLLLTGCATVYPTTLDHCIKIVYGSLFDETQNLSQSEEHKINLLLMDACYIADNDPIKAILMIESIKYSH